MKSKPPFWLRARISLRAMSSYTHSKKKSHQLYTESTASKMMLMLAGSTSLHLSQTKKSTCLLWPLTWGWWWCRPSWGPYAACQGPRSAAVWWKHKICVCECQEDDSPMDKNVVQYALSANIQQLSPKTSVTHAKITCSRKVWIWLLRGVLKVGSFTGSSKYLQQRIDPHNFW
jgi:hypothetical protein